jgi:hypothetical protein
MEADKLVDAGCVGTDAAWGGIGAARHLPAGGGRVELREHQEPGGSAGAIKESIGACVSFPGRRGEKLSNTAAGYSVYPSLSFRIKSFTRCRKLVQMSKEKRLHKSWTGELNILTFDTVYFFKINLIEMHKVSTYY